MEAGSNPRKRRYRRVRPVSPRSAPVTLTLSREFVDRVESFAEGIRARGFDCSVGSVLGALFDRAVRGIIERETRVLIEKISPLLQGLVRRAVRDARGSVPEEDLWSAALESAHRAALRFDPTKGAWPSYAELWIWPELRKLVSRGWQESRIHSDVDDQFDLAVESDLAEEEEDQLSLLKEWAGSNPKRIRALERVSAAGSIADLPPEIRSSLQRFLEARGESLAAERSEGIPAREAARILGQRERQIRRLCERGELRATRAGGRWLVDPASMERWKEKKAAA